jgi:glycosyltransferase involved in cell wall biosynthesis
MSTPKVSVIVTSFNQEDFIGPALKSVLAQDYENLEVLACDDASTDGTLEVLRELAARDDRLRVLRAERNGRLAENRNRGLRAHSGELVALLDGDDLMRPGKITAQVELLERRPQAAGCLHDAEMFDSDSGEKLGLFSRHAGAPGLRPGGAELWLNPTYFVLPSTMMFRSRCVPPHQFDTRVSYASDWLFSIELFRQGRCEILDGVYVDYRRHDAQVTQSGAGVAFEEALMVMALVDARYPELSSRASVVRTALLYGEARRRLRTGDRRHALRYARSAALGGGPTAHLRLLRDMLEARWGRPAAPLEAAPEHR